jgi:uncharacterized protein (DUF1778 family)
MYGKYTERHEGNTRRTYVIGEEELALIREAAKRRNVTVSRFLVRSAVKAAEKVLGRGVQLHLPKH